MSLLIKNITAIDCHTSRESDIFIQDGSIQKIGTGLDVSAHRILDGTGLTLLPSFVDLHTHFREPGQTHKEDLKTGCQAAVHGGYTTVHLMPNTNPVVSSMELVKRIRQRAEEMNLCQVIQSVSITKDFDGVTTSHLYELDESVPWITDDGNGIALTQTMLDAIFFAQTKKHGLMLHEEDASLTPRNSYLAEELPTWRDCRLAEEFSVPLHFCHVSTEKAVTYVKEAKENGAPVTLEVTPHHLALNDSTKGNVAPPLRSESDRLALIQAVKDGTVDAIATDHAPHTPEEKAAGANGFTGLDLSFSTCYTTLVRDHQLPLTQLSRLLSYQPAQILGIEGGEIKEGAPANLVIVDLNSSFVASEEHIFSKSKNSPLLGKKLWGEILYTLWKGRIVYEKESHQSLS